MTSRAPADELVCGASVDDLIDQVARGDASTRTVHQARCRHCQAALGEYDRLWTPVHDLVAEPVEVPESLLEDVLRQIRRAAEEPRYGHLQDPDGRTSISDRVVKVVARVTAEGVEGVRVALSRRRGPDQHQQADRHSTGQASVEAGLAGSSVALEITLAADYGVNLDGLARQVTAAVTDSVHRHTGLRVLDVEVEIDDVFE